MLARVSQSDFHNCLQTVQRGASSQSTLPVLTGIRIDADKKDSITLHSTDLELSIKVACPASVEKKGSAVVTGKLLVDIFRFLPEGAVELSLDNEGKQLNVKTGTSLFKIQTMPVEDFPSFPEAGEAKKINIDSAVLADAIRQTRKGISKDETRPVLTGALLRVESNTLLVVATDSYRLAYKTVKIKNQKKAEISVIVPGRAIEEIFKLASASEKITISTDSNILMAETDKGVVCTRLIEGQFPNYEQLIPKEAKITIEADKDEIINAISQASLMAQKNASIKLKVEKGTATVRAATAGVGEVESSVKVDTKGEMTEEMAFNSQYILDGIQAVSGKKATCEFNGPTSPGLIKDPKDKDYMYLVMPIRIS